MAAEEKKQTINKLSNMSWQRNLRDGQASKKEESKQSGSNAQEKRSGTSNNNDSKGSHNAFRTRNEDSKRFVRRNNEQDFRKNKENLKQNEPTNRNFQNRRHDHGNRRNDRDRRENDNYRRNYQNRHNRNGKTNENISNKKDDFHSKNSHPSSEYEHVIKNLELLDTTEEAADQLASEKSDQQQQQISEEKILKKKTEIKNTENFNTALYEKFRKKALTRDLSQTLDDVDVQRMKNLSLNQETGTGPESQYKFSKIPFTYDSSSVPRNDIGGENAERTDMNFGSNSMPQFSSTSTNSYQSQGRNMMRNVNSDLNYQLGANTVSTMPQINSISTDHFATSENTLLQQLAVRNVPNEQLNYKNMRTHIPADSYNMPIMENPNSQILNSQFNGARNASVESAPPSRFPYENMTPTPRTQLENGNYRGDSSQFISNNVPTQQIRNLPNTPASQFNARGVNPRGVTNFNAMQGFNVEDLAYQLKDGNTLFMQPNDNVAVSQLRSGFRNINNVPAAEFNNVFYQTPSSNKRMTPTPGNSFMEGNSQTQFDIENFSSYQQISFDMNGGNSRSMSRGDMATADMPVSQFDFVRYPPPTIMSENAMGSRKLSPNLSSSQMMPPMPSANNLPLSYSERSANLMPMRKERLPDEFASAENASNSPWLMVNLDSMPLLTDEPLQRPFPTDTRSPFTQHTENPNVYMPSQSSQKVTLPQNPMQQQFSNPTMLVRSPHPKNVRQFNSENIPMQHIPQTQNTFSSGRGAAFPEFIPNNSQFSQNMPVNDLGADMMSRFYDATPCPAEPELRGVNQFFNDQVQFNNGIQDSMTINVKDDCIYEPSPRFILKARPDVGILKKESKYKEESFREADINFVNDANANRRSTSSISPKRVSFIDR